MKYTNEEYRQILNTFLKKWTSRKVKKMELTDYVGLNDHDTFCYWIERKTGALGSIKGIPSDKFGIYKRGNEDNIPDPKFFFSDNRYSWRKKYGKSRNIAFKNITRLISEVINFSINNNFEKIDSIQLHNFFKWKIAYLYSNEKLAPFFKKELLLFAVNLLGGKFSKKSKISDLQIFINKHRNKNQTIYEYSNDIYSKYAALNENKINYFIIGSKYGGNKDKFAEMKSLNVVSTGFEPNHSLLPLYGKSTTEIDKKLSKILIDSEEARGAKMALNQFLILKPGDMIAIKAAGQPRKGKAYLDIRGYATVVEREGKVYWYDESLGHCINVEFIETDISRKFKFGYGQTIHQLTDISRIKEIFDGYETNTIDDVRKKIKRRRRKASTNKRTGKEKRRGGKPYVADLKHNRIQEEFEKYLIKQHGKENVFKEKDYIDIILTLKQKTILYEIKPYYWAEDCIRAGMGQLLTYSFFQPSKPRIELIIVGPNKPDTEELKIINFLKDRMNVKFDYISFSDY